MNNEQPLRIFICAGEASGDMHGAILIRALRQRFAPRPILFRGFGGDAMKAEGADLLYHTDQTAVLGLTPVLLKLPFFIKMFKHLKRELLAWKPDLVLTIDYPDMNLRLAAFAHQHQFKTAHYVCPQVWAWRRDRIPKIAKIIDLLLCFFPFEPDLFKGTRLNAVFIGHPLVDEIKKTLAEVPAPLPWHNATHRIALLPGSRRAEIERHLPKMLAAAAQVEQSLKESCAFIIPASTARMKTLACAFVSDAPRAPKNLEIIDGQARQVLRQSEAAAVASGTATLEACMLGCPTVLVYAASALTAWVARRVVTGVTHLGLANILAKHEIMPELLQEDFTPVRLSNLLLRFIQDPIARERTIRDFGETSSLLGQGQADIRAADAIHFLLGN